MKFTRVSDIHHKGNALILLSIIRNQITDYFMSQSFILIFYVICCSIFSELDNMGGHVCECHIL